MLPKSQYTGQQSVTDAVGSLGARKMCVLAEQIGVLP